jgi:2,3-bisphosphoglycerate-dependent phosphoglycerate mutase
MLLRATQRALRSGARRKSTVVMMRHGESTWNLENKFTGALRRAEEKRPSSFRLDEPSDAVARVVRRRAVAPGRRVDGVSRAEVFRTPSRRSVASRVKRSFRAGWYDCPLSEKGHEEATEAGRLVAAEGFKFDVAFTSTLKRAIRTLDHALEETDHMWIPVTKAWQLNERHYGGLQGLDKQQTVDKHGIEQVTVWRRSYDIPPPDSDKSSEHWPGNDPKYAKLDKHVMPTTESLATTAARVVPYWQHVIVPELIAGKDVLIAAHGNSLRALVQYLDGIPNDEITELNIPTATPLVRSRRPVV